MIYFTRLVNETQCLLIIKKSFWIWVLHIGVFQGIIILVCWWSYSNL